MRVIFVLVAAGISLAAISVSAQVEIEDRVVPSDRSSVPAPQPNSQYHNPRKNPPVVTSDQSVPSASAPAQSSQNQNAEIFYQFQVMQQELLELRGLVEQQSNQIKKLKQQRLDDYVDLDRRLSQLATGAGNSASASAPKASSDKAVSSGANTSASSAASTSSNEIAHYKSATKLIIVDRDYDAGIARLKEHLELYPGGRYNGNAQYWLGEVYLAKSDLNASKQWFEGLLNKYPLHAKVPDAKYKLGTVYHQLGQTQQASAMLAEVSEGSGSAASLAKKYLDTHF